MKNYMYWVKGIGLFMSVLLLSSSCEKNDIDPISDSMTEYETKVGTEFLNKTKDLAKALAQSLNDQTFSDKFSQELNKEWGGDYQVLFKDMVTSPLRRSGIRDILMEFGLSKDKIDELLSDPLIRILATEKTMA